MKTILNYTILLLSISLVFTACKKDTKSGCTDPNATNFDTLAQIDDGSCVYIDSTINIWSNGKAGFFESTVTGTFTLTSCLTGVSTIFLNPDTVITPADTIINNSVTPPDTTITPADTTINGDTYLLINSDANGNYELIARILNKKNAEVFNTGALIFTAKMLPTSTISDFEVFMNGNHINLGDINCNTFLQSDPVKIATSSLDTISFKTVTIPISKFSNRNVKNVDIFFGLKGTNAQPNTSLILINSIKWVAHY